MSRRRPTEDPCRELLEMQARSHRSEMRSRDAREKRDAERDRRIIRGYQALVAAILTLLAGVLGVETNIFERLFRLLGG